MSKQKVKAIRKQLEFEIAKDKVYEELLEAQNQLEIAELLEKKSWKISKPNIKKR